MFWTWNDCRSFVGLSAERGNRVKRTWTLSTMFLPFVYRIKAALDSSFSNLDYSPYDGMSLMHMTHSQANFLFVCFFFLLSTFLVWTEIVTGFLLYMHTKLGLIQVAALVRSISHMVGVCNRGWGREAAVGLSPLLQFMRPYSPHTSSGGANLSTSVETGLQDSLANKQALAVFKTTLRSVGWIGLRCSLLVRLTRSHNFNFILRCKKSFKESSWLFKTVKISFHKASQKTGQKYNWLNCTHKWLTSHLDVDHRAIRTNA